MITFTINKVIAFARIDGKLYIFCDCKIKGDKQSKSLCNWFFVKEFKDFNCKDLQTQIKAVKAVLKSINIKELYATNESFLGYVRRDIENKNRAVAVLCDYEMAVCNLDFIFDSGFLTEFSKIEKLSKSCAYTILLPQEITECITIGD